MSEYINNTARRQEALKSMIAQLHAGKTVDEVKSQFAALLSEVDATEIAHLEQALIGEGMSPMEIKRLCDVHVAAFEDALNARAAQVAGRPDASPAPSAQVIERFKVANVRVARVVDALEAAAQAGQWAEVREWLHRLRDHEQHYQRKENVLFPYLEKHGFTGPSTVMWAIHNDIRRGWKQLEATLSDQPDVARFGEVLRPVAEAIRQMIYKEENILFPVALRTLTPEDWSAIAANDAAANRVSRAVDAPTTPTAALPVAAPSVQNGALPLDVGALTAQQINLLLKHLPVDVTFVDEHDEVRFYSAGIERIFDRQPEIIGRKVQQCHPPTSINRVQRILDDFRSGQRDDAEFWIQMGAGDGRRGRFIHIRYFAVRDAQGTYRGTLEVTQDVTHIRQIEGERRLLDDAA
jgi:DUF438 domain-containing protein